MKAISLAALLLLLLLGACGSGAVRPEAGQYPPLQAGLPLPGSLDALRRPSEIESFSISLVQPHSQQGTDLVNEVRALEPQASAPAWAVFQVPAPAGSLLSLQALGTGFFYLAVADFSSMRWNYFAGLTDGSVQLELAGKPGLISPAGFFYCAVIVPAAQSGGGTSGLQSLLLTHDEAHGSLYYVAPEQSGGSDLSPGSAALPWATLQHAADSVQAGDTVIVRPGNYTGFWLQTSGTALEPISFIAQAGATIIFESSNNSDGINLENWGAGGGIHDVLVEGFTIEQMPRAGIRVVGTPESPGNRISLRRNICRINSRWGIFSGFVDHLSVEYNQCSFSQDEHGIYLSNSGDHNIARGNICWNNAGSGIQFNADASQGGDGIMSQALIEGNICFANGSKGGAALNMDGLQDSIIRNNLLYDNLATGLVMYSGDGLESKNNRVLCNTIIQAADPHSRWCVTINTGSTGNLLQNNIFWSRHATRGAIDIDLSSMADFVSDHNLVIGRFTQNGGDSIQNLADWRSATGQDLHSVLMTDESCFKEPAVDDYHILPGSQPVNIGTAHPDNPAADRDGVPRPQGVAIDAGCYEAD